MSLYERLTGAKTKTVGTKQTLKALQKDQVKVVYVARDAEERVVRELLRLCAEKNVEVVYADSMARLGQACGIQVGAASAAVLED
ncbi:MAG TPA: 50S ribosomal protein L7Ae-like protein [Clostridiales bacterium]|nr:50S ribosomal protein L7Ae-like protein [Clostridiales bacterium]